MKKTIRILALIFAALLLVGAVSADNYFPALDTKNPSLSAQAPAPQIQTFDVVQPQYKARQFYSNGYIVQNNEGQFGRVSAGNFIPFESREGGYYDPSTKRFIKITSEIDKNQKTTLKIEQIEGSTAIFVKDKDGKTITVPAMCTKDGACKQYDEKTGQFGQVMAQDSYSTWKWQFFRPGSYFDTHSVSNIQSGWDYLNYGFDFLNGVSRSLDGYTWPSLFYKEKDDGKTLIGNADSFFYSKVLGGKDAWISELCTMQTGDGNGDSIAINEYGGVLAHAAWMAGEKFPYLKMINGRQTSGFVYKISGEVNSGTCSRLDVQLYLDETPLIVENERPFTFSMNPQSPIIQYVGPKMVVFFSEKNYNKVCINFVDYSGQCFENIEKGKKICWNIVNTGTEFPYMGANGPLTQNAQGAAAGLNTPAVSGGGPVVNRQL